MKTFFPYEVNPREVMTVNAGVKQIILPTSGNVTALDVYCRATNGGTTELTEQNISNYIFEVITRIEIVGDGVDKILSLDGPALFKHLWWTEGKCPKGKFYAFGGWSTWVRFRIPFGRSFGDKEYTLNLSKYKRIECNITYNLARKNAVGVAGFQTLSMAFHAIAHMTTPGVQLASKGCRRIIERQSFTSVATGDAQYKLVQDYPLIGIGVYAREAGIDDGVDITNVRLDLGAGKPVLYDYSWEEMEDVMNDTKNLECVFHAFFNATNQSTQEMWIGRSRGFSCQHQYDLGTQLARNALIDVGDERGDSYQFYVLGNTAGAPQTFAVYATMVRIHCRAEGYAVGSYLYLPCADVNTWEDLIQPSELNDAVMYMTQGGAGAQVYVITEQIIPQ
jgi:hypothetical protein